MGDETRLLRLLEPQGAPDAIECDGRLYLPERTCRYEPESTLIVFDENDNEVETDEPDDECGCFICSECRNPMIYDEEWGWFDTEPPYKPHFKFCPYCGARVLLDDGKDDD